MSKRPPSPAKRRTAGKASFRLRGPLQELGLSNGAEQAYLKLIETGPQLMADIARQSGQFRADTYRYIDELVGNNLVRAVQSGKRKYYEAASPESIFSILKVKEDRVTDQVTELLSVFDRQKKGFTLETFDGKRGIEAAYERLTLGAKKRAELLRLESPTDYRRNKKYYPKSYWNKSGIGKVGRGVDLEKMVITNPYTNSTRRKNINRVSKGVPQKYAPFNFDFTTMIIEDRVGFIDFENEKAIVIKDARFSGYMAAIFKMLYERL